MRPFTGDAEATKAFWGTFYPRPPKQPPKLAPPPAKE